MNQKSVKKDIFLVIPSNTLDVIQQFSYNMADYNVYVITLDVLEPLILLLKKIEDYEFVGQLSPEERENICRIVGKFAHITKRKIQIDNFFTYEFLNVLSKECKWRSYQEKEFCDRVMSSRKRRSLIHLRKNELNRY